MAYQVPTHFVHGNIPVAADMTKYKDALDAIHAITGDVLKARPSAHALAGVDNDIHYFIHRYRWLYFQSSGSIEDPSDATHSITLTEDTEPTVYDLNSVDWLYPGKIYYTNGVTWCAEHRDP